MIKIPEFLAPAIEALHSNGATAVLVGGYIRDTLLGKDSKDIDIEVYNISGFDEMAEILKPFGRLSVVGKNFGVLKLFLQDYDIDFSLPRIETKISPGHKGFSVVLDSKLPYTQAAKRRDFTINSVGYDIKTGSILDPYNGIMDLKNRILTYVNKKTFIEDPLRVLRAVQFCARFNLSCSLELIELCRYICDNDLITQLPKERIYEEFLKLLLKAKKPSLGFTLFDTFHLNRYYPELSLTKDSLRYIDNMASLKTGDFKTDIILMLSVLTFDLDTAANVESFLHKFLNEKHIIQEVLNLYIHKNFLEQISSDIITDYEINILSTKVNIKNILLVSEARESKYEKIKEKALILNVFTNKPKPLIMGRDLIDLGLEPSPVFSDILNTLYDAQLKEYFLTYDEAKIWLKKYLKRFNLCR
ncbi:CCA tRNA nucleotidyltransferase [Sulfurimonas sp. HSL-1716]|uniref:CCA tRNA nucleotidyltransferase n=1 Tax=Hydrocurvibacter sulfurireducens TaxID=3131937 RepID=UPI0031FA40CA